MAQVGTPFSRRQAVRRSFAAGASGCRERARTRQDDLLERTLPDLAPSALTEHSMGEVLLFVRCSDGLDRTGS